MMNMMIDQPAIGKQGVPLLEVSHVSKYFGSVIALNGRNAAAAALADAGVALAAA